MSKPLEARVDEELACELEQLRTENRAKPLCLIEDALRSCVLSEQDLLAKVDAGLADVAAGRLTDHETVATAIRRIYRPVA